MAAPTLEHSHSFKFQQSSPLDTLVRRSSSRRTNGRPTMARAATEIHTMLPPYNHPDAPLIAKSPPMEQRPCNQLAPQSPLLHTQFRGSVISTNTYQDNSFLELSMPMARDQSHVAEYSLYADTASMYSNPSMTPTPLNTFCPEADPETSKKAEKVYADMTSQSQFANPMALQVDGDDSSLPTVVISSAEYNFPSPALQPTRGGKAAITTPAKYNFSRPGRPPALPPNDHKQAVIERNLGRRYPAAEAVGPSSSMPDLLANSQPLAYHPSSSQSYRHVTAPNSHPKPNPTSPSSFIITDVPLLEPSSRRREEFRQLASGQSQSTQGASLTKPPPIDSARPESTAQYSISSMSIYSNITSPEPSPAAGQQLFSDETRSIPQTGLMETAMEKRPEWAGESGFYVVEPSLPNPHLHNSSMQIGLSAGPSMSARDSRRTPPGSLSSRPSLTTSADSWQSSDPHNSTASQMLLSPPSEPSSHSGLPSSISSEVAVSPSYLAQNPSSGDISSAARSRQNSFGTPAAGNPPSRSGQIYSPLASSPREQLRPAGQSPWASTPDLTKPYRSASSSSNYSPSGLDARSPAQSSSDHSAASPVESSLRPQARERVQLPKGPPSRAASPAGSVYSQYSFYQLDGGSKTSPNGSMIQVSGFKSPAADEARPALLSATYTPPTRPPGAVRFASNPTLSGEESQNAHDFLQLGIQHHENNRLRDAAWCFERSAKEGGGCGVGMVMWGLTLRHGWGCDKNEPLGFKWLQKAAESAVSDLETTKKEGGDRNRVQVSSAFELAMI